jgi:hypothetical protein
MAAQTVAHFPTLHYALFHDQAVFLERTAPDAATIYSDTMQLFCHVDRDMVPDITVLGAATMADVQRVRDRMRGGYAKISCTRAMGRQ